MTPIWQQITDDDVLAYYGRVSTQKQKIEHQRETVDRWLDQHHFKIPDNLRFEDKGRRHRADKRNAFQRLMELVQNEKIDWVIVASFSRWGVSDVDEFFVFRKKMQEHCVRIYCVNSDLEMTGCTEADYYRVVTEAISNTAAMKIHADQNNMKMISMAERGQHMSGAVPYGLDLECRTLKEETPLFRVHLIRKLRFANRMVEVSYADGRVQKSPRMPLRDKKNTGYWLVPGKDQGRLKAVREIFRLYANGRTPSEIRDWLWAHGLNYYGEHWQDNAIYSVLENPAYIGMPAWGKVAKGHYRQVRGKQSREPKLRKRHEPKNYYKSEEDWVFPLSPVFEQECIITLDLWRQVKEKRADAHSKKKNRPRQRNRSQHILNGIIRCGECGELMVIAKKRCRDGSYESGFSCGTHAKNRRLKMRGCRFYWTRIKEVDRCLEQFLEELSKEFNKISKLLDAIENLLPGISLGQFEAETVAMLSKELKIDSRLPMLEALQIAEAEYDKREGSKAEERQQRAEEILAKIDHLTNLLMNHQLPKTMQDQLIAESAKLNTALDDCQSRELSPFHQLATLYRQAQAVINEGQNLKSQLLELFIARIVAKHELRKQSNRTVSKLIGFEFYFVETLVGSLGASKELCIRTGTGSARRPS